MVTENEHQDIFEKRTLESLGTILEKLNTVDKQNAELKVKFEMLEKSITNNVEDLTQRVTHNQAKTDELEKKQDRKIEDLERKHELKIDELTKTQNRMIGGGILLASIASIAVKLIP